MPLKDMLDRLGGWPVLDQAGQVWNSNGFNWHEKIVTLSDEGYSKDFLVQVRTFETEYWREI